MVHASIILGTLCLVKAALNAQVYVGQTAVWSDIYHNGKHSTEAALLESFAPHIIWYVNVTKIFIAYFVIVY